MLTQTHKRIHSVKEKNDAGREVSNDFPLNFSFFFFKRHKKWTFLSLHIQALKLFLQKCHCAWKVSSRRESKKWKKYHKLPKFVMIWHLYNKFNIHWQLHVSRVTMRNPKSLNTLDVVGGHMSRYATTNRLIWRENNFSFLCLSCQSEAIKKLECQIRGKKWKCLLWMEWMCCVWLCLMIHLDFFSSCVIGRIFFMEVKFYWLLNLGLFYVSGRWSFEGGLFIQLLMVTLSIL